MPRPSLEGTEGTRPRVRYPNLGKLEAAGKKGYHARVTMVAALAPMRV